MTAVTLWAIFTLVCRGSHCEAIGVNGHFLNFAECEQFNSRGHNFSNIVPGGTDVRWECMPMESINNRENDDAHFDQESRGDRDDR